MPFVDNYILLISARVIAVYLNHGSYWSSCEYI